MKKAHLQGRVAVGRRPPDAAGAARRRLEHPYARAVPLAQLGRREHAADPGADDGDLDGRVVEDGRGGFLCAGGRRRGRKGRHFSEKKKEKRKRSRGEKERV